MTGKTHLLIGALTGLAIAKTGNSEPGVMMLTSASAGIGALLPDIDTPRSIISRLIFPLRFIFSLLKIAHRGLTHSLTAMLFVTGLCYMIYLQRPDLELYLLAFVSGYGTHLIADMLTPAGVSIFYPLPVKIKLIPAIVSRFTAPVLDRLLFIGCIIGIMALIFNLNLAVINSYF